MSEEEIMAAYAAGLVTISAPGDVFLVPDHPIRQGVGPMRDCTQAEDRP
jgi:hypothetical protein